MQILNLSLGKIGHYDKKRKTFGIKYKDCQCFIEYTNFTDNLIKYKCLCGNNIYKQRSEENLKRGFVNTCKFFNHNIFKFILLLRKSVYPFEHMDNWKAFNEILLPEKEIFTVS